MNVELLRHIGIDVAQEGEELLVPMTSLALGENRVGGNVDSRNSAVVPCRT